MNCKYGFLVGFLLIVAAFVGTGCSHEVISENDIVEGKTGNHISLLLKTPSPDKIVFSKARMPIHETQEWTVKSMNLYLFEKKSENSYLLFKAPIPYTFTNASQSQEQIGTDNNNGTYSLNLEVTDEMIGKTFKFVMVANDAPWGPEVGETTLAKFLKSEAKVWLNEDNKSSDILVGNPSSENATGFPMTAIATKDGQEDITIGYSDIAITASLLRNVSRIDLVHNTPNMVITGAKLLNAASNSYLFQQETTEPPTDSGFYALNPTNDWITEFKNGVSYNSGTGSEDPTLSDINTLKHVFYMYEQVNSGQRCGAVEIYYRLTDLTGGQERNFKITVPFKIMEAETSTTYINPKRNHLYTIVLGDGKKVDNEIKVESIVVEDWTNGQIIEEPINPDTDGTAN